MEYLSLPNRNEVAARDAVKKALEVAASASSKATHYHKAEDQQGAIKETVTILGALGAELPMVVAVQPGVQGVFIQEAILQDLDRGDVGKTLYLSRNDYFRLRYVAMDVLIDRLGKEAGFPYIMRLFEEIRTRKINNRRTVGLILGTILRLKNLEFVAVKYRAKLRTVLTHAWGAGNTKKLIDAVDVHLRTGTMDAIGYELEKELIGRHTYMRTLDYYEPIIAYVFGTLKLEHLSNPAKYPVISNALRAHTSIDGIDNIPVEVLRGIISRPAHPQYEELYSTPEKRKATEARLLTQSKATTENVKMRESKRREELGVTEKAKIEEVTDPMAIAKSLIHGNLSPVDMGLANTQLKKIASKYAFPIPYQTVGVIFDNSISMRGDKGESKDTPRAINTITLRVIEESMAKHHGTTPIIEMVNGATTDLAGALINILKVCPRPDAVFVLSDGYENSYDGALEDVAEAYWRNIVNFPIIHLSPIGAAEMGGTLRPLSSTGRIVSLPANWRGLKTMMDAALIDTNFKAWLKRELEGMVENRPEFMITAESRQ